LLPCSVASYVGEHQPVVVTDDNGLDLPSSIDYQSDLSAYLSRELAHRCRQVVSDYLARWDSPSLQALDASQLIGL